MTERTAAVLSDDGRFRYRLERVWDESTTPLPIVMLNPSTADADKDDATIRKCRGFAQRAGAGGIVVVNLYAYRTRWPAELKAAGYPVGPENDEHLLAVAEVAARHGVRILAAWGANAPLVRAREVGAMMAVAGATFCRIGPALKGGYPRHPCIGAYLPLERYP